MGEISGQPRVSIVTISFNQVGFLRQCIESVVSQDGVEFEYIVVDPGSTDGSRELIASYGSKVIRVFEKDQGPADGLNKGFAVATGDIFGFINSDDYLLPGSLRLVSDYFMRNGFGSFVTGGGFIAGPREDHREIVPSRLEPKPLLYGACTIFQQGTFFPAQLFRSVGGFNVHNRTCWDGELFHDFVFAGFEHRTIDAKLAVFRLHEGSISGSGRLREAYEVDRARIFKKTAGRDRSLLDVLPSAYWRARKAATRLRNRLAA